MTKAEKIWSPTAITMTWDTVINLDKSIKLKPRYLAGHRLPETLK
jgi:hypothetical protein